MENDLPPMAVMAVITPVIAAWPCVTAFVMAVVMGVIKLFRFSKFSKFPPALVTALVRSSVTR